MDEFWTFLYSRSDAVLIASMQQVFWLICLALIVLTFRTQIRNLLAGLSTVRLAGVSIQLKDKRDQIEAYVTLGEAFVGMLSQPGSGVDSFCMLFPPSQVDRLNFFVLKYLKETDKELVNLELVRNIALLLMRHVRFKQALSILDKLLALYPQDDSVLSIKASTLLHSRVRKNVELALEMYVDLCARFPLDLVARGNFSCCYSVLGRHAEAMEVLREMIVQFGFAAASVYFDLELLQDTRAYAPDLFVQTTQLQSEKVESNS
jgi:hypothetical protein